jgi:PRC-barrel domain
MNTRLSSIIVAVALAWAWTGSSAIAAENYSDLLRGSEVKGAKVKNLQNEEIGDIHEILVEPVAGLLRFAVLSVGKFLGMGDTKVAVPWLAFQITKEGDKPQLVVDATKDRLKNAPRVEGENYDRLYAKETAESVYVYWHITWIPLPERY